MNSITTNQPKDNLNPVAPHTPGPWEVEIVEFHGCTTYVLSDTQGGESDEEGEANVKLISAAPDLLQAAKEWLQYMEANQMTKDNTSYLKALTAISKAEGK